MLQEVYPRVTSHTNERNHIDQLFKGNYANITDEMTYEATTASTCETAVVNEKYMPLPYGVGMQKNSVYKDLISQL